MKKYSMNGSHQLIRACTLHRTRKAALIDNTTRARTFLSADLYQLEIRTQRAWVMVKSRLTIIGETLFVFGLLGWLYGVAIQITHPEWLTIQLTHLTPWLRVDIFAIISFILSIIGFIMWRSVRN